jgi:hypothetical protein
LNGTSDYLYTVAEVSVAFIGFAAIVLAIRERTRGERSEFIRAANRLLVERGLAALFFSLAPMLLEHLGIVGSTAWRLCSSALAVFFVYTLVVSLRLHLTVGTANAISDLNYWIRFALAAVVLVLQVLQALGLGLTPGPGWYLVGLTWLLVQAAMVFTAALTASSADA